MTTQNRSEQFDFGEAVRRLKGGGRVARAGWNGKDMYVFLAHVSPNEVVGNGPGPDLAGGDCCFIAMKDAQGRIVVGWLASQTDMLAEDWVEVR